MFGRRHVAHERNVVAPGKILGIQRSSDQELFLRRTPGGLEEKLLEGRLTIGCISSEVGKIGTVLRIATYWLVNLGINAAVERRYAACAEMLTQLVQRSSSGITQDQVERLQSVGRK